MAAETRADAVELSMWKRTWWMMSEKRSKEWGFKNAEGDQAATYCRAERVIGICSRSLAILGITEKGVFEQCGTGVGPNTACLSSQKAESSRVLTVPFIV